MCAGETAWEAEVSLVCESVLRCRHVASTGSVLLRHHPTRPLLAVVCLCGLSTAAGRCVFMMKHIG